jgi:hypothetical protein
MRLFRASLMAKSSLFRETHPNVLRSMDDVAGGYAQIMLAMEQRDSPVTDAMC